jgi:lipid-binding SYLF domain-containing protein
MKFKIRVYSVLLVVIIVLAAISVTGATKAEIDVNVQVTIQNFYDESPAGKTLAEQASGLLVFPSVVKAGIGIGGEYGEGALLVDGETVEYYNTTAASIGFQLGAQVKSQVILFMTDEALDRFRNSDGWEAGVDGSVALIEFSAAEEISSNSIQDPIIGFILSNRGLMYNLTFEGSKMTKIDR